MYMQTVADRFPRFGKKELFFLLSLTCNCVVSDRRGSLPLGALVLCCFIVALPGGYSI